MALLPWLMLSMCCKVRQVNYTTANVGTCLCWYAFIHTGYPKIFILLSAVLLDQVGQTTVDPWFHTYPNFPDIGFSGQNSWLSQFLYTIIFWKPTIINKVYTRELTQWQYCLCCTWPWVWGQSTFSQPYSRLVLFQVIVVTSSEFKTNKTIGLMMEEHHSHLSTTTITECTKGHTRRQPIHGNKHGAVTGGLVWQ